MFEMQRLKKLAGMITEEAMTMNQAVTILRANGIDTRAFSDNLVKQAMQNNPEQAKDIQAAYRKYRGVSDTDVKQKINKDSPNLSSNNPEWLPRSERDATIHSEDFKDINYLRKTLWELSGDKPKKHIIIWSYDEKSQSLKTFVKVVCSPLIFKDMAKAMLAYTSNNSQAIFISGNSNNLLLIYINGIFLENPIPFAHNSPNKNPANDWVFVGSLPKKLSDISKSLLQKNKNTVDYKAWINTRTNKVIAIDLTQSYYDAIRASPEDFGIEHTPTMSSTRLRELAERKGWCAVGVNKKDDLVGAVVTALNDKEALRAARMLLKIRYNDGNWNALRIITGMDRFILNGRREIADYLQTGEKPRSTNY